MPHIIIEPQLASLLIQDGIEVTHAYMTLRTWEALGEEVSVRRYLREVWKDDSDTSRAWPIETLVRRGLVITPGESDALQRELETLMYGELEPVWDESESPSPTAKKKRQRNRVVPHPFPSYQAGRWPGTREDLMDTCPRPGTNVVYFLFDESGVLAYVGSTNNVYGRFPAHHGKPWIRYEARECSTREDAYWLEALEVIERKPYLNADDYVAGRVNAIVKVRAAGKPAA